MVDFAKLSKKLREERQQAEMDFRESFEPKKVPANKQWKLWECCTDLSCHVNDQRFTRLEKFRVEGLTLPQWRQVKMKPSEIPQSDKDFWTKNDKSWAWHCYLCGAGTEMICEFVGGRKEDLIAWVKAVCRGEESCSYAGQFNSSKVVWTPRQDRMLRLMYDSRIRFHDAARLLGRFPFEVKQRLNHLNK